MAGTELLYGVNPVIELLRSGRRRCQEVLLAQGRREGDVARLEAEARRASVRTRAASREELTKLVRTDRHQGVVARCEPYRYAELAEVLPRALADPKKAFLLVLDAITDPQNLGSLIRTAHLMGVHAVILPKDKSASVNATVVKASAGATEYLEIVQVTNLAAALKALKEAGVWVAGAEADGEKTIYDNDFRNYHYAIVLGSEGRGMRRLIRERCDQLLGIPMQGRIDSYNVSVAGALFMGEVMRQRRSAS